MCISTSIDNGILEPSIVDRKNQPNRGKTLPKKNQYHVRDNVVAAVEQGHILNINISKEKNQANIRLKNNCQGIVEEYQHLKKIMFT